MCLHVCSGVDTGLGGKRIAVISSGALPCGQALVVQAATRASLTEDNPGSCQERPSLASRPQPQTRMVVLKRCAARCLCSQTSAHLLGEVADRVVVCVGQKVAQAVSVTRHGLGVVHQPRAKAAHLPRQISTQGGTISSTQGLDRCSKGVGSGLEARMLQNADPT